MRRSGLAFVLAIVPAPAVAALVAPPPAPPLPPPTGNVVTVSTLNGLQSAVANLASGTTVMIQPGTYRLTGTLRIRNNVTNVALRGASGNRDDVVILGNGMAVPGIPHGITWCRTTAPTARSPARPWRWSPPPASASTRGSRRVRADRGAFASILSP